jgi:hypothetical protein
MKADNRFEEASQLGAIREWDRAVGEVKRHLKPRTIDGSDWHCDRLDELSGDGAYWRTGAIGMGLDGR